MSNLTTIELLHVTGGTAYDPTRKIGGPGPFHPEPLPFPRPAPWPRPRPFPFPFPGPTDQPILR